MTSDFLARLDAAVDQRCACGCGRPITDSSPSAYYASEDCATDWHYQRRRPYALVRIDGEALADLLRQIWEPIAREIHRLVDALLAAFRRLHEQLRPLLATATVQQPPAATGPRPRGRVARTIDPPHGYTVMPRGRTARRPALR